LSLRIRCLPVLAPAAALNLLRRLACAATSRCAACCRDRPVQPLRHLSEKLSLRIRCLPVLAPAANTNRPFPIRAGNRAQASLGVKNRKCCGAYSTSTGMVCRSTG